MFEDECIQKFGCPIWTGGIFGFPTAPSARAQTSIPAHHHLINPQTTSEKLQKLQANPGTRHWPCDDALSRPHLATALHHGFRHRPGTSLFTNQAYTLLMRFPSSAALPSQPLSSTSQSLSTSAIAKNKPSSCANNRSSSAT